MTSNKCPPPDVECLWRVAGVSRVSKKYKATVGLVRAPDRDTALRLALAQYSPLYTDLEIPGEPLHAI